MPLPDPIRAKVDEIAKRSSKIPYWSGRKDVRFLIAAIGLLEGMEKLKNKADEDKPDWCVRCGHPKGKKR